MVQYYYDRYNNYARTIYVDSAPWTLFGGASYTFTALAKSYTFDPINNTYGLGSNFSSGEYVSEGTAGYKLSGNGQLDKYIVSKGGLAENNLQAPRHYKDKTKNSTSTRDEQGSLRDSNIIAENGTYPSNGRHTDGYWYVRKTAVGPLPPGQVINFPYSTIGNGGRKLTRLNDGTLICAVNETTSIQQIRVYRSNDDGITWRLLLRHTVNAATDFSIVNLGDRYGMIFDNDKALSFVTANKDGGEQNSSNIDNAQSSIGNVSLAIDPISGHLYAAWASRNASYPSVFNIRYSKSTDIGLTWSEPEQLTTLTTVNYEHKNPSIVIRNGLPIILFEAIGTYYDNDQQYQNSGSRSINAFIFDGSTWKKRNVVLSHGSDPYAQTNPSAVVDKNGVIHVVWHGSSKAYAAVTNIYYSKSTDGGLTWSTPVTATPFNGYAQQFASITADRTGKLFIVWSGKDPTNSSNYRILARSLQFETWGEVITVASVNNVNLTHPSTLYDHTFTTTFGDVPPLVYTTPTSVEYKGTLKSNDDPTLTLNTADNRTLYENDTILIDGQASDVNNGDIVNVKYSIDGGTARAITTAISDGKTPVIFAKQLTFKSGKLYDGETALTSTLADGTPHIFKVWAEDDKGGKSVEQLRTFYAVPNRAPLLSIDTITPSGTISTDKFTISGTSSDQDANASVTVTSRLNANNAVEIYNGPGGAWEFDVILGQLHVGENTIVVEVIDNYGAKASKTIRLNKNEVKTPILQSVARYKIEPPKGSAKGVLLWIQRDAEMDLKVEISMALRGEQEQYIALTPTNTAPVSEDIVEDEFYHEATEPKDNIILKLTTSRNDVNVNHKIHLISGVLE